jgi:hypothetical protein
MSKFKNIACLLLVTLLLSAGASAEGAEHDGWERVSRFNSFFNQDSMVHITGVVTNIDRAYKPLSDMTEGFAVTVKTDDGKSHLVVVGPIWFTHFYKQKWDIAVGDRVDIRGSEVKVDGKPMIIATWGRKGSVEMTVRNRQGRPVWDLGVEDF